MRLAHAVPIQQVEAEAHARPAFIRRIGVALAHLKGMGGVPVDGEAVHLQPAGVTYILQ